MTKTTNTTPHLLSVAFKAGRAARAASKKLTANPYHSHDQNAAKLANAWHGGWTDLDTEVKAAAEELRQFATPFTGRKSK